MYGSWINRETVFVAVLVSIVIVGFVWKKRARLNSGVANGPGCWNLLFGHLPLLIRPEVLDNWHEFLLQMLLKHEGKTFQLCPWPQHPNSIFSISPQTAEYVLKTNFKNFRLPDYRMNLFSEIFGEGIFASNAMEWKLHRKAASHIFTTRQLQDFMTAVFVRHATGPLCEVIERHANNAGNATTKLLDLQNLFFRFTMDCFAEIAFGEHLNTVQKYGEDEDSKLEEADFATAFDRAQYNMVRRVFAPWWKIERALGLGRERQIAADIRAINSFVNGIVQRRKKEAFAREDLLSHYIRFSRRNGKLEITDTELRDTVTNFIIAGRDTTACLLSWLFYELSQHPEVEAKLRAELAACLGERPSFDEDPARAYQQASKLHFLDACLFEVLRLHPSVPDDVRQVQEDDILPDGSLVYAGQAIAFNPYLYGRSPYIWGDTVLQFQPYRFLDDEGKFVRPSQFKLPAFSAGPRLCLGRSVALLEAKLVVAIVLSRFAFQAPKQGSSSGQYQMSIILRIKDGLPLQVRLIGGFSEVC